jgi:hypothetical protein
MRDGFVDRYSGLRLVNPGVLRLLSALLPRDFPAHPNWKMSESHVAFWELFPTIDHVVPVARGGADEPSNWVTTSMFLNSAKSNALLDEIGWTLYPAGTLESWDGLTQWLMDYCSQSNDLADLEATAPNHRKYILNWWRASRRTMTADD